MANLNRTFNPEATQFKDNFSPEEMTILETLYFENFEREQPTTKFFKNEYELEHFIDHLTSSDSSFDEDQPNISEDIFLSDPLPAKYPMILDYQGKPYVPPLTRTKKRLLDILSRYPIKVGADPEEEREIRKQRMGILKSYTKHVKRKRYAKKYRNFSSLQKKGIHPDDYQKEGFEMISEEMNDKKLNRDVYYEEREPEYFRELLRKRQQAVEDKYYAYMTEPAFREQYKKTILHNVGIAEPNVTFHYDSSRASLDPRTLSDVSVQDESNNVSDMTRNQSRNTTGLTDRTINRTGPSLDRTINRTGPALDRTVNRTGPVLDRTCNCTEPVLNRTLNRTGPVLDRTINRTDTALDRTVNCTGPVLDRTINRAGPLNRTVNCTRPILDQTVNRTGPVLDRTINRTGPVLDRTCNCTEPILDRTFNRTGPVLDQTVNRTGPVLDRTFNRTGPLDRTVNCTRPILDQTVNRTRPVLDRTVNRTRPVANTTITVPTGDRTMNQTGPAQNEVRNLTKVTKTAAVMNRTQNIPPPAMDRSDPAKSLHRTEALNATYCQHLEAHGDNRGGSFGEVIPFGRELADVGSSSYRGPVHGSRKKSTQYRTFKPRGYSTPMYNQPLQTEDHSLSGTQVNWEKGAYEGSLTVPLPTERSISVEPWSTHIDEALINAPNMTKTAAGPAQLNGTYEMIRKPRYSKIPKYIARQVAKRKQNAQGTYIAPGPPAMNRTKLVAKRTQNGPGTYVRPGPSNMDRTRQIAKRTQNGPGTYVTSGPSGIGRGQHIANRTQIIQGIYVAADPSGIDRSRQGATGSGHPYPSAQLQGSYVIQPTDTPKLSPINRTVSQTDPSIERPYNNLRQPPGTFSILYSCSPSTSSESREPSRFPLEDDFLQRNLNAFDFNVAVEAMENRATNYSNVPEHLDRLIQSPGISGRDSDFEKSDPYDESFDWGYRNIGDKKMFALFKTVVEDPRKMERLRERKFMDARQRPHYSMYPEINEDMTSMPDGATSYPEADLDSLHSYQYDPLSHANKYPLELDVDLSY